MKSYKVEIKAGDYIEVGRFRNVVAKVKSIELDEHNQPVVVTNKGSRKLFNCRFSKLEKKAKDLLTKKYKPKVKAKKHHSIQKT
jgi:hypothetical protein